MKRRRSSDRPPSSRATRPPGASPMRIVGGHFRGRRLLYSGDWRVRPMKDRTREAVFNLLGPVTPATHVWDLFAGTGAMGLEAISRGAQRATLFERHIPTAKLIEKNIEMLDLGDRVQVVRADVFHALSVDRVARAAEAAQDECWLIFCCPPYAFYQERLGDLRLLLTALRDAAPPSSVLVVEAEVPFDFATLWPGEWNTRDYPPATVGIYRTSCLR